MEKAGKRLQLNNIKAKRPSNRLVKPVQTQLMMTLMGDIITCDPITRDEHRAADQREQWSTGHN